MSSRNPGGKLPKKNIPYALPARDLSQKSRNDWFRLLIDLVKIESFYFQCFFAVICNFANDFALVIKLVGVENGYDKALFVRLSD